MTFFLHIGESSVPKQEYIKPQEWEIKESNASPIGPDPVCLL